MEYKMITIGSLFSGIGCFELGLLRGIPNSQVIWQCEKDTFCQSILKKHWPNTRLYTDITKMDTQDVVRPDIMCAGFPCQDLSISGLKRGIYEGKKSNLYWYAFSLFSRLRPEVIVLENVPNLLRLGGREILGSLAQIRYDAEWTTLSARQFGAPHRRERVFIVAYPNNKRRKKHLFSEPNREKRQPTRSTVQTTQKTYWQKVPNPPPICRVDDGIRYRVHRTRALGNAIVPQCTEYIGQRIYEGIIKPYLL
tara:strand:+ start:1480 stop:2235 length:756 start_codon:yes stop_codon:yes gene_type:complete